MKKKDQAEENSVRLTINTKIKINNIKKTQLLW